MNGRTSSYGQDCELSLVDRLGTGLNFRAALREARSGAVAIDIGCGYEARLGCALAARGLDVTGVDVALDPVLDGTLRRVEGQLPDVLSQFADGAFDVAYCVNVLEHLDDAVTALAEIRRITAVDGTVFINVPSWRGKRFLEFAAFRLGKAPADEMNDHRMYYDVRDLWPLAIQAGFQPQHITCRRVKGGLNTRLVVRRGRVDSRR
jgi:SAM-dependent methyltransferase